MIASLDLDQFQSLNQGRGGGPGMNGVNVVPLSQRKQDVLSRLEKLPALPGVVHQVIRLTGDPNSRAEDFVSLFSNDQALTAKLLRIVNSPFYGLARAVTTIPKAIVILGHRSLKSLVLASASTGYSQIDSTEYGYTGNGLWLHSVSVARMIRYLSKSWLHVESEIVDELFVVGLMHDIGKIVLVPELARYSDECAVFMNEHQTSDVTAMETAILGIDHCEVGAMIVDRWNIGEGIGCAITDHHHTGGRCSRSTAVLALADALCDEFRVGIDVDCHWVNPVCDEVLQSLGLDESALEQIREQAPGVIEEAGEMIAALA